MNELNNYALNDDDAIVNNNSLDRQRNSCFHEPHWKGTDLYLNENVIKQ